MNMSSPTFCPNEQLQARLGVEIPEADRARFIRPYENRQRLEALR